MDFSMKIMFTLLLIGLLQDGGDFTPGIFKSRLKRGSASSKPQPKAESSKNDIQSANETNSNLEWVRSTEVPKNTISVTDGKRDYYIGMFNCKLCFFHQTSRLCVTWSERESVLTRKHVQSVDELSQILFLVNRDSFEMMQWKKCTSNKIPHMAVEICDGNFIAKKPSEGYIDVKPESVTETTEVLTINTDFKVQHLNVIEYFMSSVVTSESIDVLRHFQASNRNCNAAKESVKFDQNTDKTISYQIGRNHAFGGNMEVSAGGKIPGLFNLSGKLGLKYDYTRSRSNSTSSLEKTFHSLNVEVEIPPNHFCSIDITSNTFTAEIPFTAEVTRIYNNYEIRKTFVNGTYVHQEVTEIQTVMNPCQLFSDAKKCESTQT